MPRYALFVSDNPAQAPPHRTASRRSLRKHHGEREAGLERHLDRTGGRRAEDEPVLAHTHLDAEMCEDTGRAYSM